MDVYLKLVGILIVGIILILFILFLTRQTRSLDSIKSDRVGDGQHGDASWGTDDDLIEKGDRKSVV